MHPGKAHSPCPYILPWATPLAQANLQAVEVGRTSNDLRHTQPNQLHDVHKASKLAKPPALSRGCYYHVVLCHFGANAGSFVSIPGAILDLQCQQACACLSLTLGEIQLFNPGMLCARYGPV